MVCATCLINQGHRNHENHQGTDLLETQQTDDAATIQVPFTFLPIGQTTFLYLMLIGLIVMRIPTKTSSCLGEEVKATLLLER